MSNATWWIPCSERMPDLIPGRGYSNSVLVFDPRYDDPFTAYWGGIPGPRWIVVGDEDDDNDGVTHWMPLPPSPPEARP